MRHKYMYIYNNVINDRTLLLGKAHTINELYLIWDSSSEVKNLPDCTHV